MSDKPSMGGRETCPANAAPYVLGALTETEQRVFAAHLESCVVCREEVAELQLVVDALPSAAPQLAAPEELRGKLMASIAAEGGARASHAGGATRSVLARLRGRGDAEGDGRRRWSGLAIAGLAAATAAIVLALLAIAGGGGGSGGPAVRTIRAEVSPHGASALLQVSDGHAELYLNRMPQTPPQRVYEVWVKRAGAPEPTDALFTVTRAGNASVLVPGAIKGVRSVLVTAEPLGGSRVPTSAPVIVAHL